ncbi:hypothetical protein WN55_00452 [Dufourea novaeangliae]|uniref:Uncharacterized protein n=1 Tax=Dufourea novaeangliae TaxID=178035 RepID=A0A154PD26_DUFNO|nr:hypothetical protein WN55_00452 [Dufourea novaeangliae]
MARSTHHVVAAAWSGVTSVQERGQRERGEEGDGGVVVEKADRSCREGWRRASGNCVGNEERQRRQQRRHPLRVHTHPRMCTVVCVSTGRPVVGEEEERENARRRVGCAMAEEEEQEARWKRVGKRGNDPARRLYYTCLGAFSLLLRERDEKASGHLFPAEEDSTGTRVRGQTLEVGGTKRLSVQLLTATDPNYQIQHLRTDFDQRLQGIKFDDLTEFPVQILTSSSSKLN